MVGWHHWLNGHGFEQTSRDSEGQGSLVCCIPWGRKELDTTERLNNNWRLPLALFAVPRDCGAIALLHGHPHGRNNRSRNGITSLIQASVSHVENLIWLCTDRIPSPSSPAAAPLHGLHTHIGFARPGTREDPRWSAPAPWAALGCELFSAIRHVKKLTHLEDFSCGVWQAWVGGSFDGQGLSTPFTLWHFLSSASLQHSRQWLLSADASERWGPAGTCPHFCGLWGHGVALSGLQRHVDSRPGRPRNTGPGPHVKARGRCSGTSPSTQPEFSGICSKISGAGKNTGKQSEKH